MDGRAQRDRTAFYIYKDRVTNKTPEDSMPVLSTKDAQGNTTLNVLMGAGISTITQGMPVCITLTGELFGIRERFSKKAPVQLQCSQITQIQEVRDMELVPSVKEGSKRAKPSPLPSYITGLMDSKKNIKAKMIKEFIVINYGSVSKKVLIFEKVAGTTIGSEAFIKEIQQRANTTL
jgi:hypothetical protein